jgi:hypothetical protein
LQWHPFSFFSKKKEKDITESGSSLGAEAYLFVLQKKIPKKISGI